MALASLPMSFVHLHCHSEYSLLDGANRIEDLIARAQELEQPALAITDHGNLHAAWEFRTRPGRPASGRSSGWRPTSPPATAGSAEGLVPTSSRTTTWSSSPLTAQGTGTSSSYPRSDTRKASTPAPGSTASSSSNTAKG